MAGHGIKSQYTHPYQRFKHPFWRHSNLPPTMGYSEESKELFERKKIEFDANAKYIPWQTKPKSE